MARKNNNNLNPCVACSQYVIISLSAQYFSIIYLIIRTTGFIYLDLVLSVWANHRLSACTIKDNQQFLSFNMDSHRLISYLFFWHKNRMLCLNIFSSRLWDNQYTRNLNVIMSSNTNPSFFSLLLPFPTTFNPPFLCFFYLLLSTTLIH